jgi:predicted transcriptional regulator
MPVFHDPEDAENELQKLLLLAVPRNKHGFKSINHLAKLLKVSRWSVQKWIVRRKLPPNRAVQIVDLAEGRVSLADFTRFVYDL